MPRTAADTNLIVRLIARDDHDQLKRVEGQLASGGFFVDTTVVMEIEWVLRGSLGFSRSEVNIAMSALCALPSINFAEPDRVDLAVEWHAAGMDFADAIHLAGAADCDEFVTFDRDLARRAAAIADAVSVRLL